MISIITEKMLMVVMILCTLFTVKLSIHEICEHRKCLPSHDNKLLRATLQQKPCICYFFATDLRAPGNKMVLVAFPFMDIFCMVIFSFLKVSFIERNCFPLRLWLRHDIGERMQIIMRGKTIHDHGFGCGVVLCLGKVLWLRNFHDFVSPPVHTFNKVLFYYYLLRNGKLNYF